MLRSICVFGAGTHTNIHMMVVVVEEAEGQQDLGWEEENQCQQQSQQQGKEGYLSWTFWVMGSEH